MEFEDPRWWEHLPSLKGIGLAAMMVEKVRQADVIKSSVSKAKNPRKNINDRHVHSSLALGVLASEFLFDFDFRQNVTSVILSPPVSPDLANKARQRSTKTMAAYFVGIVYRIQR